VDNYMLDSSDNQAILQVLNNSCWVLGELSDKAPEVMRKNIQLVM